VSDFDAWALAEAWHATKAAPNDEPARKAWAALYAEAKAVQAPREQLDAAEECVRLRSQIEAGDGGAVLDAIGHCAEHRLVIPEWLADEYLRRHGNVGRGQARDWNDERAFGRAYPKGTNIAGIRAKVEDAPAAYVFAVGLLAADPTRPFDAGFYEEIGAHIGVGKTRAQELLAMALKDDRFSWPPLADLRKKLAAGLTRDEALREVSNAQTAAAWDARWSPGADGVWRKADPGK
jgi:hypothetical protein